MIEHLYLLILTAVVVLALLSIYMGKVFLKNGIAYKVQRIYLIFIIIHCIYAGYFTGEEYLFNIVGAPFSLFYAPFFYCYIQAIILGDKFKVRQTAVHFILGLLFLVVFILLYVSNEQGQPYFPYYFFGLYLASCIQLIFYAVLVYLKFNKVAKDSKIIAFMNQSIIIMIVSVLVFSGLIFRDKTEKLTYYNSFLLYIIMLLIVVVIFRYNVVVLLKKLKFYKKNSKKEYFNTEQKQPAKLGKYYKSKLSVGQMEDDIKELEKLLNDEIYLQPDLTLEILAKKLNISTHRLSQIFTSGLDSNFNKVINSYRIQYAVELLTDVENKATIEEIGLKSGFNSRASFYRAFNVTFNMTPSDYRKKSE